MPQSNRRGTLVVYVLLALLLFLLIMTQAVAPPLAALLLLMYGAAVALPYVWRQLQRTVQQRVTTFAQRDPIVTRAARAAQERVQEATPLLTPDYQLQDIGLVIDERRSDGLMLRRARFISLDEESVRPYVVLFVEPYSSTGRVIARFEIEDRTGKPQFIYEMEHFLRPGENLLLPDYRLPLKNNTRLSGDEGWHLRVSVDGKLLGIHRFHLLPSSAERLRQAQRNDGELSRRMMLENDEDDAMPLSLEDLLSQHQR